MSLDRKALNKVLDLLKEHGGSWDCGAIPHPTFRPKGYYMAGRLPPLQKEQ